MRCSSIRAWTKKNHFAIHDAVAGTSAPRCKDRFWNEHNFVFRKTDGLFYHAKGATPAWADFAADFERADADPAQHGRAGADHARARRRRTGWASRRTGRAAISRRSAYMRRHAGKTEAEMVAEQTRGIDARFFCGNPDVSELPGAYKSAAGGAPPDRRVRPGRGGGHIEPVGSIMAGDWQRDAPWRRKKEGEG